MSRILHRIRLCLAFWIYPKLELYMDADIKTQCRKLALEEAVHICIQQSWRYGSTWQNACHACQDAIQYRADNSEAFTRELLRRRS